MTISTTTTLNRYVGNASTTVFPYTYRILNATDLVVTKRSASTLVESTLSYPADYSVSGVGNASGGSITLATAPATGDVLVIERAVPATQPTSIRNQGSYFPETHENVFDRQTMVDQQQATTLSRTFKLPHTLDPAAYTMDLPVPVAGQVLSWSTNGLTNGSVASSSVVLPGSGRTTGTLTEYLANNYVYNVFDYDAVGDGVTNDAAPIQAAIAAAVAAGGGVIYLPISVGGFRVATTLTLNSAVPLIFTGPGKIVMTTDFTLFLITGSKITFEYTRVERTPAAGTTAVFTLQGASEIRILYPYIAGAPLYAIYCNGASKVQIVQPYIYRSYDTGISIIDGSDDIEIIGGRIIEPGYGNASTSAGKGIGVGGVVTLVTNVRILGTTVIDSNQIGVELFGNSGVSPGVQFFTIKGVILRQSKPNVGSGRFMFSLDGAQDGTVQGCVASGGDMGFETAGGCKRVMYDGNVSTNSLGSGFGVSNGSGNAANDPDQIILANCIVQNCATVGISVTNGKTVTISNPLVDTATQRGIFINDPGASSRISINGGIARNCGQSGVYLFTQQYVDWTVTGTQARANNTTVHGGDDIGFLLNADNQAHQQSITLNAVLGAVTSIFPRNSRTSALSLSASTTTSLGLPWRYRIAERWKAVYRLPVQVTGGVAGLKFDTAALPAGLSGRMVIRGNTSGTTATDTEQTTTLTSSSSTGFLTASFTGFVEIWLYVSGGTVDGDIDLQVITGASAAGSIFTGASVELIRE